jgi:hypothetical protein
VPTRRREFELSAERPTAPGLGGTVARITTRWELDPDGAPPSPAELRTAFEEMQAKLDELVGPTLAAAPLVRPERELAELMETYRPRQTELVDLLREEGEITETEHARLRAYLAGSPGPTLTAPAESRAPEQPRLPYADRPIASAPIEVGAPAPPARPVAELIRIYQIASLKQAGAVRARRQISFAEYMALKRHFESGEPGRPDAAPEARPRKNG